jgi:translation initiation factor IF-3
MHNNQSQSQGNARPAVPQAGNQRPQGYRPYQGGGGSSYQGNRPWQRREERPQEKGRHRLNGNIRVPEVRVVQDGKQLGIMKTYEAQRLADDAGLDLVEIAPQGNPPVCSIMDYGKFKYEEKIKQKEHDRKQRESAHQLKEIRLTPSIGDHDVEVKVKQCKEFLEEGKRVLVVVKFQKRQLNHKEMGFEVVKKFIAALGDKVTVESEPRLDGNRLNCRVAPKQ